MYSWCPSVVSFEIGDLVDGQAGPCMGRCMGGAWWCGVWGFINDVLNYLGWGIGDGWTWSLGESCFGVGDFISGVLPHDVENFIFNHLFNHMSPGTCHLSLVTYSQRNMPIKREKQWTKQVTCHQSPHPLLRSNKTTSSQLNNHSPPTRQSQNPYALKPVLSSQTTSRLTLVIHTGKDWYCCCRLNKKYLLPCVEVDNMTST